MRIINFEPEGGPTPPGALVARFDAIIDRIRLNGLLLKKNGAGEFRVHPQKLRGMPVAEMDRALAVEITLAAVAELGGRSAHARKAG